MEGAGLSVVSGNIPIFALKNLRKSRRASFMIAVCPGRDVVSVHCAACPGAFMCRPSALQCTCSGSPGLKFRLALRMP